MSDLSHLCTLQRAYLHRGSAQPMVGLCPVGGLSSGAGVSVIDAQGVGALESSQVEIADRYEP